ncbi:MAG: sensor histidine kinase [Armatimonadota bacterium]
MNMQSPSTDDLGFSRQWLLRTLLAHFTFATEACMGSQGARQSLHQLAISLAHTILERYQTHPYFSVPFDSVEQFTALLLDLQGRFGGSFQVETADMREVVLTAEHCPWEDMICQVPSLCQLITSIFGALAAAHFGYACVYGENVCNGGGHCRLRIALQPGEDGAVQTGVVFTRAEMEEVAARGDSVESLLAARNVQAVIADGDTYELLFQRQLRLIERLEQALSAERTAAEELRSLGRLKQDFLSNVSHELRTPITTILGYLSLLEQEVLGKLSSEQHDAMQIALRNVDRLNRLVSDLLDFSSLSRGQFLLEGKPVNLLEVCATSLQHTLQQAKLKGVTLEEQLVEQSPMVLGDGEKLTQIVDHLLGNAIKFCEPGSRVTLTLHRRDSFAVVEVKDTGIGMTSDQLEHVFIPFVQGESGLNRRYGGLGMGLSLIQNLVSLHGGEVTIDSTPGKGTTVTILLPLLGSVSSSAPLVDQATADA